jgi:hypothetical protein
MNNKLKAMVFGGLIAGSLAMSAVPAMAWDWHWLNRDQHSDQRWDNRGWDYRRDSRSGYDNYEQARQQALYDASHGASRKKIAEDNAIADQYRRGYRR